MTERLGVTRAHRVLEVGTGSGYQTAVLAPLVKQLYTVEVIPELALRARELLEELGVTNVTGKVADGGWGWEESGKGGMDVERLDGAGLQEGKTDKKKTGSGSS